MFVLVFLCFGPITYCAAFRSPQPCQDMLDGCGAFESADGELNECCECRECLGVDCQLPFAIHCAALENDGDVGTCCPCTGASSLSDSCSSSLEECANPKDLRRIFRLLKKSEKISRRTIARCGVPVTDECAGPRVLRRLQCIYDEIHETAQDILEDCFEH